MRRQVGYREAVLSSAETMLYFARRRHLERYPEIGAAMATLDMALTIARAAGATHEDIRAVVTASVELNRVIRDTAL